EPPPLRRWHAAHRPAAGSRQMTCRDLVDFLMDYLSGELPPLQRATFDKHLRDCPRCIAYLKNYQETVKLGRDALRHRNEEVPDEVPEELVQAILAARRK